MKKLLIYICLLSFISSFSKADSNMHTDASSPENLNNFDINNLVFIENKGQWDEEVMFLAKTNGMNAWITKNGIMYDFYTIKSEKKNKAGDEILNSMPDVDEVEDFTMQRHVVNMAFKGSKNSMVRGTIQKSGYYNYFIGNDESKWARKVRLYKEVNMENIYEGVDARLYFEKGRVRYDLIVTENADISQMKMEFEGQEELFVNENGELLIQTSLGTVEHRNIFAYQEIDGKKKEVECMFKIENGRVEFKVGNYNTNKPLVIDPLVYSTFLGGSYHDYGRCIAVDANGCAYVTGYTTSSNYPTKTGAYDDSYNGSYDIFITKLSADGTSLQYSTFIGGSYRDVGYGIEVDENGCAYITGYTQSTNYPTTSGTFDGSHNGNEDSYVTKLSSDGTVLVYSTFLGGGSKDVGLGITVNENGYAFVTGYTASYNYPVTPGAFDVFHDWNWDTFVTKISTDGTSQVYSTFLGGNGEDAGRGIAVDKNGCAYISGWTKSSNFPTTSGAYDESYNGSQDGFATKISTNGNALVYSTYLGGNNTEKPYDIALDNNGCAYVTGETTSSDFPTTTGAFDESYNGGNDCFVTKFSSSGGSTIFSTYIGGSSADVPHSISVDAIECTYIAGHTYSIDYPVSLGAYNENHNGGYCDAFITKLSALGNSNVYSSYLGSDSYDNSIFMDIDDNNCAYLTGQTYSYYSDFPTTTGAFDESYNGGYDCFVSKLNLCASPIAKCKDATVYLDDNGEATITVDDINDGSNAGCGLSDISISQNTFDCSDVGQNPITLTVTDTYGNTDECISTVTVIDDIPPDISISMDPIELWPPNHKMSTIEVDVTVSDNCPDVTYYLVSVSSNEADNGLGDGDKPNDIQNANYGSNDLSFDLRAERSGNGNGRTYTIVYEAEDASGNTATATAYVVVPHDQSKNGAFASEINANTPELMLNCFPNPANTEVTFSIEAARGFEEVSITITDLQGNKISSVITGKYLDTGRHLIPYNISALPSGSYYYTIKSGSISKTKLMNIVR